MKNKSALFAVVSLISAFAFQGCETLYNINGRRTDNTAAVRAEMERQQLARDAEIARASAQSAEVRLQQLDSRINRLEDSIRQTGNASGADIASLRADVVALKSENAMLREDRANMKNEIIAEISSEVSKLLAAQQRQSTTSSKSLSATGYEHKVQSGESLSAIAKAYGVSMDSIKKANNLKSDMIRIGQVLFVPDK